MNTKNVCVISGSVFPGLAERVAEKLGVALTPVDARIFANTEQYVRITESVRGDNVFIIQSMADRNSRSIDQAIVETLLLVDAAKRASAGEITVVVPYFAYGRQDRKAKGREPISAAMMVRALQSAGTDRIVTIDMHSPQIQAVFNGPFDHLTAEPEMQKALRGLIAHEPAGDVVIVAPDAGGVKTAEDYGLELGVDVRHIPKVRRDGEITRAHGIEGLEGKVAIVIDDMIDTAGTLVSATQVMKDAGARRIIAVATHGILSAPAVERLADSAIDTVVITDTIENGAAQAMLGDRLHVVAIDQLLANAIARIADGDSVSELFGGRNYK